MFVYTECSFNHAGCRMQAMIDSHEFLKAVLDALAEQIAVTDETGEICFVNRSWIEFHCANGGGTIEDWRGVNYLRACERAADAGDSYGTEALAGIRGVIEGREHDYRLEYPCHSPDVERWFILEMTPFQVRDRSFFIMAHHDITRRKLIEDELLQATRMDGLTGIYNRQYFDEFMNLEWRRCTRLHLPITLAMIDIDHFKLYNDTYGHQAGDECLKGIALTLNSFARRPGDLCARYGGEEFAVVLADVKAEQAVVIVEKMLRAVSGLNIPNEHSPIKPVVTISIGMATVCPERGAEVRALVRAADSRLYEAKRRGRNRVVFN